MATKMHFDKAKGVLVIEVTGLTAEHVKGAGLTGSGNSKKIAYQQYTDVEDTGNVGPLKASVTVIQPLPKGERTAPAGSK